MNDFERLVQGEIERLQGPEFPTSRAARRMRNDTIRALARADIANEPWTGENGVLGPNRPPTVIGEGNFYKKSYWYKHPLVREVIAAVTDLYRERDAAERERARQENRAWLEGRELDAASRQFDKAAELLNLANITRETKAAGGVTSILGTAVNLNMKASDLARRALGLPADVMRSEVTGAEGGPLRTQEMGRVHGSAEHVAAVARILVEAGAIELRPAEPGSDAADDEVHSA